MIEIELETEFVNRMHNPPPLIIKGPNRTLSKRLSWLKLPSRVKPYAAQAAAADFNLQ